MTTTSGQVLPGIMDSRVMSYLFCILPFALFLQVLCVEKSPILRVKEEVNRAKSQLYQAKGFCYNAESKGYRGRQLVQQLCPTVHASLYELSNLMNETTNDFLQMKRMIDSVSVTLDNIQITCDAVLRDEKKQK